MELELRRARRIDNLFVLSFDDLKICGRKKEERREDFRTENMEHE